MLNVLLKANSLRTASYEGSVYDGHDKISISCRLLQRQFWLVAGGARVATLKYCPNRPFNIN